MAGSIEQRGENKWRLVVSEMRDGKRVKHYRTITASSPKEAKKQLALFVAEVEKGQYVDPSKQTFAEFVQRWLKDYAESHLAAKTLHRYKEILEKRVLPALGHLKLEKIRPNHLLEFYASLQVEGIRQDGRPGKLSGKTILQHHRVISSILNDAVQWQLIPSNPASRVKPPKVHNKQQVCYDEDQVKALLAAVNKEEMKYRVMIHLAVFTGMRRGEILGLEWQDVDFDRGTLEVRQASQYLPGQGTFTKAPKNESSVRFLTIPPFLVNMLRQYKKEQAEHRLRVGDLWQGSDRLFTTWDGKPMHPDTISKWFPKFLKRHNLPSIPFHGLRHTAATMLINQGLPAKSISARLGHSNISTTFDIYGHYLKSADKEAANRLEQVYQRMIGRL